MSGFQIRPARPEDALGIVHARTAAWQTAYRGLMPDDYLDAMSDEADDAADRLRDRLQSPPPSTLLIGTDAEGTVLGMCAYGPPRDDDIDSGQLYAINVVPAAWGTGLGRQLLRAAERGLATAGHRTAYLWVVDGNVRARRFYQRAGWRCDGATKLDDDFGTGVTEVRYRRDLPLSDE